MAEAQRVCAVCGQPEGPNNPIGLYVLHGAPIGRDVNNLPTLGFANLHTSTECVLGYQQAQRHVHALSLVQPKERIMGLRGKWVTEDSPFP